jgi:hypothetical protein
MRVGLYELDVWALRGLAGVLKILEARLRADCGFGPHAQSLATLAKRRLDEVCEQIAARPQEKYPDALSSVASVDKWFVDGLNGFNNHLANRLAEGPPVSPENVETLRHELQRLQEAYALAVGRRP